MDISQVPSQLTPGGRAVLDAASRLFYEQGIAAVGVETVAEAAGVTKKTLYDRFKSKSALVCAYLIDRDQRYRRWTEAWIEDHPEEESILVAFDALESWMDAYSPKGCAFVHAHAELLAQPDHPAHEVIRAQKRWMYEKFRQLATAAGAREPEELSTDLLALLEGAVIIKSVSDISHSILRARHAAGRLVEA